MFFMELNPHSLSLAHVPLPGEDEFELLSFEDQFLIEDCIAFTEEATSVPVGVEFISRLICAKEDDEGIVCQGAVLVGRLDRPPQVNWKCLECGNSGTVVGFTDTPFDLRKMPAHEAEKYLNEKYVSPYMDGEVLSSYLLPDEEITDIVEWVEKLTPEERERVIDNLQDELNEAKLQFRNASGGLDYEQIEHLLSQNWEEEGMLQLNSRLSFDEVNRSFFFNGAREFLKEIQQQGYFELTPQKNLRRKQINDLVERINWPETYIEKIKQVKKVLNEDDVWLLHVIRVLLDLSGLIRMHKGVLKPVQKRADLSGKTHAGKLYRHLFIHYFRSMNISYLSAGREYSLVQQCVPYTLFRLQQIADDWGSVDNLTREVLLGGVYEDLANNAHIYEKPADKFDQLILEPLEYFGLMESRHSKKPDYPFDRPDQFRKTGLFDRFIQVAPEGGNFWPASGLRLL
jgi:hypothetical protein